VLIRRYGAGTVAPFSMLVPLFGMSSAAVVLGERLELTDVLGGLLVVGGILLGAATLRRRRPGVTPATPASQSADQRLSPAAEPVPGGPTGPAGLRGATSPPCPVPSRA
jgi:O-acetylserine/cysteine efflux transporter